MLPAILVLVLNLVDIPLTLWLLSRGNRYLEGNPVMAALISWSPFAFIVVKSLAIAALIWAARKRPDILWLAASLLGIVVMCNLILYVFH